jgi:hypothetical protein
MRQSVNEQDQQDREDATHARTDRPTISANEIGDYGYCARSWWLKRARNVKAQSAAVNQGRHAHAAAGRVDMSVIRTQRFVTILAWGMLGLGAMLLLMVVRRF